MRNRQPSKRSVVAVGAVSVGAVALIMAGCGSAKKTSQSAPTPAGATSTTAGAGSSTTASTTAQSVQAQKSRYGTVLFDGQGRSLYVFTRDNNGPSQCYTNCASRWPPLIVARTPAAGPGVNGGHLGTRKRSDGTLQATYAGKPLYHYSGDRKPGQIGCQAVNEFGGLWYVVKPDGTAVL